MELKRLTFGELVNLCLHTAGFFHNLQENPAETLEQAGYEATPHVVQALKQLDYTSIRRVYLAFNPTTAPMC